MSFGLIDIGINLTNRQFHNDLDDVLERAWSAGVQTCLLTGTDLASSHQSLQLCRRYAMSHPIRLYCTAGIHPHDADHFTDASLAELHALLHEPEVIAVGETGLDFNRNFSTRENQIHAFEAQIELAISLQKPLFLHERDAFDTQVQLLERYQGQLPNTVIHCFTGHIKQMQTYLDMGFYIGITGWICDDKRGKDLQAAVQQLPLNRLMLETDAPYLLPKNTQPKPMTHRNEPANLIWVAQKVAEFIKRDIEEVIEVSRANSERFFGLKKYDHV